MAKSKKRAGTGRPSQGRTAPDVDLLGELAAALDEVTPARMLSVASTLLALTRSGGNTDDDSRLDLIDVLSAAERAETSAALLAIATLTGDPDLRRRTRRQMADRGHVVPRWLAELDRTTGVEEAIELSDVFRGADDLVVGARVPGGHPLTAVVHVVNDFGGSATDGYVVGGTVPSVRDALLNAENPDERARDVSPADARVRISAALAHVDLFGGSKFESGTWPRLRPLVEWIVGLLPEGGTDDARVDLTDEQFEAIVEDFLASPCGTRWAGEDARDLVDDVVGAGGTNGVGDPLVWSVRSVRKVLLKDYSRLRDVRDDAERAPEVLRDLIRYGHAERGLRPELTNAALTAVDECEAAFVEAVRRRDDEY